MVDIENGVFPQILRIRNMQCDLFFLRCPENGAKACSRSLCVFPRSNRPVIRPQQQSSLALLADSEFQVEVIPLLLYGPSSLFAIGDLFFFSRFPF